MSGGLKTVHLDDRMTFEVPAELKLVKKLGTGAYGTVASFYNTTSGKRVAVKQIANAFDDLVDCKRNLREIKILQRLQHPNIVAIQDIYLSEQPDFQDFYMVLDLMQTDLHRLIGSRQVLTEEHHQFFLYQLLCGVHYLHSANLVHRDLKPSNILVNSDCELKICDFGMARGFASSDELDDLTDYVVTRWWRAPEVVLTPSKYTQAVDLWSVGCILGELMKRVPIFRGKDHLDQLNRIFNVIGTPSQVDLQCLSPSAQRIVSRISVAPKQPWLSVCPMASPKAVEALDSMLKFPPDFRVNAEQALGLPYFQDYFRQEDLKEAQSPIDWRFDKFELTKRTLQKQIFTEFCAFHPDQESQVPTVPISGATGATCHGLGMMSWVRRGLGTMTHSFMAW